MNGVPPFGNPGYNQDNHGHNNHHGHHGHHGHNDHHGHHGHHGQQENYGQQTQGFSVPGMQVTFTQQPNYNYGGQQQQQYYPPQQQQYGGGMNVYVETNSNCNHHYNENLPHMVKRSQKVGGDHHHGSQYFDQFYNSNLKNEFHTPEADSITVYHTHNIIVGLEVHYRSTGNGNVATLTNKGSHHSHVQTSNIHLNFGEHFTEISGRCGDSIDRICIKTSGGRCLEVGGNGGSPFGNLLPWGHPHIVSFGGSTREFLDSLYVLHN